MSASDIPTNESGVPLFGRQGRKIAPFHVPPMPGAGADVQTLLDHGQEKAANLNLHVLGPGELAESEWQALGLRQPDLGKLRRYRLERIREQLRRHDYMGVLLYDPLNTRYATDSTNMQLWCTHDAVRYAFVPTEGPVILFDYPRCEHLSGHLELVDESRPAKAWFFFKAGSRVLELAEQWAEEIAELVTAHGGGNKRLAIDRCNPEGIAALQNLGVEIFNGEEVMELAREIKSGEEIAAMRCSLAACEASMKIMEDALVPGMSENRLWSILHAENIARGGEWIETRLLASGPRTNPWLQECSSRPIEAGDIVAFDTDLIGPYGYCADISRTWLCGDGTPTNEQHDLYARARDHIEANMELVKPGISFKEFSQRADKVPDDCLHNRYPSIFHGIGLADEYPSVGYWDLWEPRALEGELLPGMTLCIEAYIGRHGGHEGVKLEEQVLVTETGYERLSKYPFDERLS